MKLLDTIAWMSSDDHENCHERCSTNAAAHHGHLEMVQWLHAHRSEGCTSDAMDKAAANGHFEVVKFLHLNRTVGCSEFALDYAARNGHFEVVKWLRERRSEGCPARATTEAAMNGHVAVVEYLYEKRSSNCKLYRDFDNLCRVARRSCVHEYVEFGEGGFLHAVFAGHMDMVKWFWVRMPSICIIPVERNARSDGYWSIVKYLALECKLVYASRLLQAAGESGRFDMLEWLIQYVHTEGRFLTEEWELR